MQFVVRRGKTFILGAKVLQFLAQFLSLKPAQFCITLTQIILFNFRLRSIGLELFKARKQSSNLITVIVVKFVKSRR
jgi:hypothetical protein